ncbi:hypothetical protein, partial [Paracoccus bogoriensis]|uniref:hypothetical protein n=1 Tax=Paracoccus bogoriensis TaxID=242065 RepID=UPI0031BB59F5
MLASTGKPGPRSIDVGAPEPELWTICQFACVPRWKPMPMALTTAEGVSVVASAEVDPISLTCPCFQGHSQVEFVLFLCAIIRRREQWAQARSHQVAQAAAPIAFYRRASLLRIPPGSDTS